MSIRYPSLSLGEKKTGCLFFHDGFAAVAAGLLLPQEILSELPIPAYYTVCAVSMTKKYPASSALSSLEEEDDDDEEDSFFFFFFFSLQPQGRLNHLHKLQYLEIQI